MENMKYLLTHRNFIFLAVLFSFFDNFGMDEKSVENNSAYLFKVVFLGDADVGKTQIVSRYVEDSFVEEYKPTVNVEYSYKLIKYNKKNIQIEVWDTAGQESFKSIAKYFCKGSQLIVFVYAIDNKNSFINIKNWVDIIKNNTNENPKFLLVGNKCDLEDKRQVSTEEAKQYATENNMEFMEVSVKSRFNIDIMFNSSLSKLFGDENKEKNNLNEVDKLKIDGSQDDNNSQKKYLIYNNLSFWNKYCSCCPCLKKN